MTTTPEELVELRRSVADSQGWYVKGRLVSRAAERPEKAAKWMSDPKLIEQLCAAEEAETVRIAKAAGIT